MMLDTITPIIWDPNVDAILVQSNHGRHLLPLLPVDDNGFGASLPDAIWEAFGLSTILLENLDDAVYVVELRSSPKAIGAGHEWVSIVSPGLPAADEFWVTRWLTQRASPIRPWFEHGWFDRALAYIDTVLDGCGRARIGHVSQVKHWALSSVMCVETTSGAVFFKAGQSESAIEPNLITRLANRWPTSVPTLIAHSPQDNWWITEDLHAREGPVLYFEERLACIELLGRIHIETANAASILDGLPIDQCSLEQLARAVPSLMGRIDRWNAEPADHEHWWPLDDEQRTIWLSLGPTLIQRLQALASTTEALGIPLSLTHGDVHSGNMAVRDEGPALHDWANGMVAHPFFDLAVMIKSVDDDVAYRYLTSYFGTWAQAGWNLDDLWTLWRLAKPVSALFETDRALRLCDSLGETHQFSMISVLYGWVRRLLGSIMDDSPTSYSWSTTGIAAKR